MINFTIIPQPAPTGAIHARDCTETVPMSKDVKTANNVSNDVPSYFTTSYTRDRALAKFGRFHGRGRHLRREGGQQTARTVAPGPGQGSIKITATRHVDNGTTIAA